MPPRPKTLQRQRLVSGVDPTGGWAVSTEHVSPTGRHLSPGTEVSIHGERGRFRFQRHVTNASGVEWIDVIGGPKGVRAWRSFRPDRIKRVHYKRTSLTGEEARRLINEKNRQKRKG